MKKSVRLSDLTVAVCANLSMSYSEVNYSGSINKMAERYTLFAEHCLPDLTDGEFGAIAQAYNGHLFKDVLTECKAMGWQIDQAIVYDRNVGDNLGLSQDDYSSQEKLSIAARPFMQRVSGWSISQRLAVIAKVNIFWKGEASIDDGEE